jgi:hypothetical protein
MSKKILEGKHALHGKFFRQEKFLQDLLVQWAAWVLVDGWWNGGSWVATVWLVGRGRGG